MKTKKLPFFYFLGKRSESRSTTGCGHINFWFYLTQADVIQPESVPHDATWGFVFVRRLRLAKQINDNKKKRVLWLCIFTTHNHSEPWCVFILYHVKPWTWPTFYIHFREIATAASSWQQCRAAEWRIMAEKKWSWQHILTLTASRRPFTPYSFQQESGLKSSQQIRRPAEQLMHV